MTFIIVSYSALTDLNKNETPNYPVAHLSDLLISVSFKIDDDTLHIALSVWTPWAQLTVFIKRSTIH